MSTCCCAQAPTRSSVNTAAIARPELLAELSRQFGSQCIVLSVDARTVPRDREPTPSGWEVTTHGGRRGTGIDAIEWAARGAELGVGEILLNSMDFDGTKAGFDLPMLRAVRGGGHRAGDRQRRRRARWNISRPPLLQEPTPCWPPACSTSGS